MPAFVSPSVGRPSRPTHAGVGFCSVLLTVKTVVCILWMCIYLALRVSFFYFITTDWSKKNMDTLGSIILHTFVVSWGAPYIPFLCCFAS